jgi:hypothetical protein
MRFDTISITCLLLSTVAALPQPIRSGRISIVRKAEHFFIHRGQNHRPAKRATGEVVTIPVAVSAVVNNDGIGAGTDKYVQYSGDGSTGDGWPDISQWASFTDMFNANKAIMLASCSKFTDHDGNPVPNTTEDEITSIQKAIEQVARHTKVDHRFILAVMIQESGGCVRVPTTNWGVRNPGLMQDHDGEATCNSDIAPYPVLNPCPQSKITAMVRQGTAGTLAGDGLANCINEAGSSGSQSFYRGARIYNSGSIAASGLLQDGIATHCYSSDIANRLTGWVSAPHDCTFDG